MALDNMRGLLIPSIYRFQFFPMQLFRKSANLLNATLCLIGSLQDENLHLRILTNQLRNAPRPAKQLGE
jgi:hypothetical protein